MDKGDAKKKTIDNQKGKEEYGFLDKVLFGKGSVSEPWPTVEEVLQDPAVQKEIEKVETAFDQYQGKNQEK